METFSKVVGQEHIKEALSPIIMHCQEYGYPLPPVFLTGGSGMGKTYIARAIVVGNRKTEIYNVHFPNSNWRNQRRG